MKKIFAVLPILALACSVNANAGFLDGLTKVLNTTGGILNTATGKTSTGSGNNAFKPVPLAQITDMQAQRIHQIIIPNTNNKFVNQAIIEAQPNIEGFLKLSSCQNGGTWLMTGKYQSPQPSGTAYTSTVMSSTKYHPLNQCLTVQSIGNWRIDSRDTLDFDVVYVSDVSSESTKKHLVMKREPDGQWLLTNFW